MTAEDHLRELIAKARAFEEATLDEMPVTRCRSDPCPFCTAGTEMGSAILDAEDFLSEGQTKPDAIDETREAERGDSWPDLTDEQVETKTNAFVDRMRSFRRRLHK